MGVKITKSLNRWLIDNGYAKELVLITFGHVELFTEDMNRRYLEWLLTDEGKKYLEVLRTGENRKGANNSCAENFPKIKKGV